MSDRNTSLVSPQTLLSSHPESDITIVSTTNDSQVEPPESSPAIINGQSKPAPQSSNSEDTQRKTTSNIWAHFNQSGRGDTLKGKCKYCIKELSAKSSSGTNHLWQHF
ncbi:hypothetical protein PSTG_06438 [Puccinia striiformis f. sp. tritici PST-78]|uniref:BED-type domain-containing protein n=1 Tax=Puccinia striiformis f. sp. tritici PST-78 TaxID=1165861 RepID=A0A0L0VLX9_9BASI|nr:hypothetical protein PSTG_06438 [Puccinia striiformis f. sp. tritici PST-78]